MLLELYWWFHLLSLLACFIFYRSSTLNSFWLPRWRGCCRPRADFLEILRFPKNGYLEAMTVACSDLLTRTPEGLYWPRNCEFNRAMKSDHFPFTLRSLLIRLRVFLNIGGILKIAQCSAWQAWFFGYRQFQFCFRFSNNWTRKTNFAKFSIK